MKKIIIIVICVLTAFLFGFFVSPIINRSQKTSCQSQAQTVPAATCPQSSAFQDGWDAAKERLKASGFGGYGADMVINRISGEIVEIKSGKLVVRIRPLEPLADPVLDNRVVLIGPDTTVKISKMKDQATYQRERSEYERAEKDPLTTLPPTPMTEEPADLSSLAIGDSITVFAAGDIKEVKEFTAISIVSNSWRTPTPPVPAEPVQAEENVQ